MNSILETRKLVIIKLNTQKAKVKLLLNFICSSLFSGLITFNCHKLYNITYSNLKESKASKALKMLYA